MPLQELFEQLDADLQSAILELLCDPARKSLRAACRAARALVNSRVARITLFDDDICDLPLRLHERFPRLEYLDMVTDGELTSDAFTDFALAELAPLSTLVKLDLKGWRDLGTAAASALRDCCPQLDGLQLEGTGLASPAALQALACLTRLTGLDLSSTAVAAGLQHLTRLKGLECLGLDSCRGVTDAHLQPLSTLTRLTNMDAGGTGLQGSSLAALSRLRRLNLFNCSCLDATGLAAVARITCLTYLDVSHAVMWAQPAQLAQLAQLTNLQELRLWGNTIRDEAAALLELPRLGQLVAKGVAAPPGQGLSSCAITRLVITAAADMQPLRQLPALRRLVLRNGWDGGLYSISAQTQLTKLAVGTCEFVTAGNLAVALRGLKQLQVLELGHASCFDMECLLEVAGLQHLQELWLDGGRPGGVQPGVNECWGMLHRCTQLRRVTLQRCGPVSKGALAALVTQPGMLKLVLGGEHGLVEHAARYLQALGEVYGCQLLFLGECRGPLAEEFYNIPI
jgi:hypothetical protein